MVVELVSGAGVLMRRIGNSGFGIPFEAGRDGRGRCRAIVVGSVALCRGRGVSLAVTPDAGNQIKEPGVRFDVGGIDDPVIPDAGLESRRKFLRDKFSGIGQRGQVAAACRS